MTKELRVENDEGNVYWYQDIKVFYWTNSGALVIIRNNDRKVVLYKIRESKWVEFN